MKCYNLEEARCKQDKVTALYLRNCGIDQLPPLVFALPQLRHLHLNDNALKTIPPQISSLKQLRTLSLANNQIAVLPQALFELQNLEKLNLSGNRLTEIPAAITGLSSLNTLLLSHNQLEALPKEIQTLGKLKCLEADSNKIRSILGLHHVHSLRRLVLSHNRIRTFPKTLCRLKRLERLDLSYNRLSHLPADIHGLRALHFLFLERNNLKSLPEEVGDLRRLRQLVLNRNKLTQIPRPIWSLPWLAVFEADNNKISALPPQIEDAQRLERLKLSGNGISRLPDQLPTLANLRTLDLSGNELRQLPALPASLKKLSLSGNPLRQVPESVCQLTQLEELSLRDCQLKQLPGRLHQWRHLRKLDIRKNQMETMPPSLFQLRGLRKIQGAGNALSDRKLIRFISKCNSYDVPAAFMEILYEIIKDPHVAIPLTPTPHLLQVLALGVMRDWNYKIRRHLLQERSPVQEIPTSANGASLLLLGQTGFEAAATIEVLQQQGLTVITDANQSADYIVLGRLRKTPGLPPLQKEQRFISRLSLTRFLNLALGRKFADHYDERKVQKLQLMLLHREEKNRKLALQLLQSGGVPLPLLTDIFLAWKLQYEPRQTYEQLLLQNCSEEALRTIYTPWGLRSMRPDLIEQSIGYYTADNELDGDRMRQFLFWKT